MADKVHCIFTGSCIVYEIVERGDEVTLREAEHPERAITLPKVVLPRMAYILARLKR